MEMLVLIEMYVQNNHPNQSVFFQTIQMHILRADGIFFTHIFAATVPTDLIRQTAAYRHYHRFDIEEFPHRPMQNNSDISTARQKKNERRDEEKGEKGAFKKFHYKKSIPSAKKKQTCGNVIRESKT